MGGKEEGGEGKGKEKGGRKDSTFSARFCPTSLLPFTTKLVEKVTITCSFYLLFHYLKPILVRLHLF